MDFFDNALDKAKEVVDAAKKKTGEIVTTEKQRFDISSLKSKREKDYAKLGRICFETVKDNDDLTDEVKLLIEDIKSKNEKIDSLFEEMNAIKNKRICPSCGNAVPNESVFCNRCGAQLYFDSEEK